MRDSLVAKRYARALRNLVGDSSLEKTCEQLTELNRLFDHESIGKVLRSPVVPAKLKEDILKSACDQMKADPMLASFMRAVVEAGRVAVVPTITACFQEISDTHQNLVRTKLISAVELDEASVKNIESVLERKLGKKVSSVMKVDPSLLGGLVVEIGHNKIDLSLKTKIDNLAQSALS